MGGSGTNEFEKVSLSGAKEGHGRFTFIWVFSVYHVMSGQPAVPARYIPS